jgi:hypothetical protein
MFALRSEERPENAQGAAEFRPMRSPAGHDGHHNHKGSKHATRSALLSSDTGWPSDPEAAGPIYVPASRRSIVTRR